MLRLTASEFAAMLLSASLAAAAPLGDSFTYQGQLKHEGAPLTASVNMYFRLWTHESAGAIIATDGPMAVDVVNGLFTASVDFGSEVFEGSAVWLDVQIEYPAGTWTTLSPRQSFRAIPYALFATRAETLDLPYAGIGAGTATPFAITQTGTGRAVTLATNNVAADESTLVVIHGGQASAGEFWNNNPSNSEEALFASSASSGAAIFGQSLASGPAVSGTAKGSGRAASFLTESAGNSSPTVYAEQEGTGRSGHFRITNPANDSESVAASTQGDGAALSGYTTGAGPAVHAKTDGTGYALHADSTDDVAPGGGGVAMFGREDGINVAVDGNEIMARNNGATSTLFLNNDGGDVVFGGAIDVGLEIVSAHVDGDDTAIAYCPAGKRVIGGGCAGGTTGDYIEVSEPWSGNAWRCRKRYNLPTLTAHAYAICANVK